MAMEWIKNLDKRGLIDQIDAISPIECINTQNQLTIAQDHGAKIRAAVASF